MSREIPARARAPTVARVPTHGYPTPTVGQESAHGTVVDLGSRRAGCARARSVAATVVVIGGTAARPGVPRKARRRSVAARANVVLRLRNEAPASGAAGVVRRSRNRARQRATAAAVSSPEVGPSGQRAEARPVVVREVAQKPAQAERGVDARSVRLVAGLRSGANVEVSLSGANVGRPGSRPGVRQLPRPALGGGDPHPTAVHRNNVPTARTVERGVPLVAPPLRVGPLVRSRVCGPRGRAGGQVDRHRSSGLATARGAMKVANAGPAMKVANAGPAMEGASARPASGPPRRQRVGQPQRRSLSRAPRFRRTSPGWNSTLTCVGSSGHSRRPLRTALPSTWSRLAA